MTSEELKRMTPTHERIEQSRTDGTTGYDSLFLYLRQLKREVLDMTDDICFYHDERESLTDPDIRENIDQRILFIEHRLEEIRNTMDWLDRNAQAVC